MIGVTNFGIHKTELAEPNQGLMTSVDPANIILWEGYKIPTFFVAVDGLIGPQKQEQLEGRQLKTFFHRQSFPRRTSTKVCLAVSSSATISDVRILEA